jgi:hypothetical protein
VINTLVLITTFGYLIGTSVQYHVIPNRMLVPTINIQYFNENKLYNRTQELFYMERDKLGIVPGNFSAEFINIVE